jgi:predicted TIM-barrel fold metal-dependent hydrolase
MLVSRDADLPIIDAHHHFWDMSQKAHPWLRDEPMIPFRYGDYSSIRRNFLPDDYRSVARGHNVVSTVTMEGEWDEEDLVAESKWMTDVAKETGLPAAHVSRTILHTDGAREELARHAAYPIVRGIRHKPTYAPGPGRVERGVPGGLSDPKWQRGYAALAPNRLHFELQAPWWHVDEMLDLIAAFPDTPIVINHAFMPVDRSADGLKGWRAAIKRAASAPQVSMKVSGIGIKGQPWRLEDQRPIIDGLIDAFGIGRCMFASNFPVDSLVGSFDTIYSGFKEATADLPRADRIKLFHDNAVRIYRLDIPLRAT